MYELICVSTQGYRHILNEIPCEDAGMVRDFDKGKIFAVADGHGDPNCPRSSLGSRIACEIVTSELEQFCKDISENAWSDKLIDPGEEQNRICRQLAASVIGKWIIAVEEHLEENPLSEEERESCDELGEMYDRGEFLEHIYGTTLAAGLLTDRYLLLMNQGDCRLPVFHADGKADEPVPWDERCVGNVTTSICDGDAAASFRFAVIDMKEDPVIACFAGSDGVEDSFASIERMYSYYRGLLIEAGENGTGVMEEDLQKTIPDLSRIGSRDDITIAGFVDASASMVVRERLERDIERTEAVSNLKEIEDRLASINGMGKLDALKARYENALAEVERARRNAEDLQKLLTQAKKEYIEIVERKEALERKKLEAEEYLARLSEADAGESVADTGGSEEENTRSEADVGEAEVDSGEPEADTGESEEESAGSEADPIESEPDAGEAEPEPETETKNEGTQ